ncbi:S1 family peptidase [Treponema socranskii]|uniref:S1 family peptidase n=1 Tax=Treponema socranskii TaxID=53419 RepID=UPI0023EF74D1|nr:serine protease [Treponema socranskii]
MEISNFIKKCLYGVLVLCFSVTAVFAAPLRNYVCIVRSNLPKDTVTFLKDYRDRLENRGYASYAKNIDAYLKGSFGSGFVFYASNGKPYVVTNRHVVKEAETVNVEFENEDGSDSSYKELKIIAVDEDIDIALVALPDSYTRKGLTLSNVSVRDGDEVWSAGFPGLGSDPMWQLGKGTVTNARAKIKELLSPDISTLIQHSAQVDAGNSGGPLLTADSKSEAGYSVIGINTWKATYRESTNFSIPAAIIKSFIQRNIAGEKKQNIDERVKQFVKSTADKNELFFSLGKYISNEMISKTAGDDFFDALATAPSSVRSVIVEIFAYDPIEGLRYALAYKIWNAFQGEDGALTTEASAAEESTNGMKVSFTPQGKDAIPSLWTEEQGVWRLSEFGEAKAQKSAKKKAKKSSGASSVTGLEIEDPYLINATVGPLIAFESQTSGFNLSVLFMNTYFGGGPFIQTEKVNNVTIGGKSSYIRPIRSETMTTVGAALRFQVPLAFNKFIVAPFAEVRPGFTNFVMKSIDESSARFYFGIGGGAYASYRITDWFAPMVGIQYMHSIYSEFFGGSVEHANNMTIFAGIKLATRE